MLICQNGSRFNAKLTYGINWSYGLDHDNYFLKWLSRLILKVMHDSYFEKCQWINIRELAKNWGAKGCKSKLVAFISVVHLVLLISKLEIWLVLISRNVLKYVFRSEYFGLDVLSVW